MKPQKRKTRRGFDIDENDRKTTIKLSINSKSVDPKVEVNAKISIKKKEKNEDKEDAMSSH